MSKVIVLTGAGGVLCSALAKALANEGHKIAVLDLKLEAAERVANEINKEGGKAVGIVANVLEKASLELAKAEVNEKLGPCDILINGAGGSIGTFAVQIAKAMGAEVTAVDSAIKEEMLRRVGADHFIDYAKEDFTRNGETRK